MIRILAIAAVGFVALYAVVLFVLWRYQERVVFQPPSGVAATYVPARQVRYQSTDGIDLFAYIVGECTPDRTVLLAFHGNADVSRWLVPWASSVVRRTGACVVLPEYRGYDGVAGVPTYIGSAQDAQAALAYVRDSLRIPPANLVYFGHSLGTAIAAELAAVAAPRSLVLQAPFSSAREMGRRMFLPGLNILWPLVSRVHFNTIDRVRNSAASVWVSHGDNDFVIPVRMGRQVFAAAKHPGELLIVRGAGHNDVPDIGGPDYWTWLGHAVGANTASTTPAVRSETRLEP